MNNHPFETNIDKLNHITTEAILTDIKNTEGEIFELKLIIKSSLENMREREQFISYLRNILSQRNEIKEE